jgi:hypothetical protein
MRHSPFLCTMQFGKIRKHEVSIKYTVKYTTKYTIK